MSGVLPLLPLQDFMQWTGKTVPFTFQKYYYNTTYREYKEIGTYETNAADSCMGVAGWNDSRPPATAIYIFHRRPTPQFLQPSNGILPLTRQRPRPQGPLLPIIPTYCLMRRYTQACSKQTRHRPKITATTVMLSQAMQHRSSFIVIKHSHSRHITYAKLHKGIPQAVDALSRDIYNQVIYHLVQLYLKAYTKQLIHRRTEDSHILPYATLHSGLT